MLAAAPRPKARPTLLRPSLKKTPAAALRPKLTAKLPKKVERKLSNSKLRLWQGNRKVRLQRKSPSAKDKRRFVKRKKCAPGSWHNSTRYCRPAIRHEDSSSTCPTSCSTPDSTVSSPQAASAWRESQANNPLARGVGKPEPVADNKTAAGRKLNRRVEMIVSGDVIGNLVGQQPSADSHPVAPPSAHPSNPQ